MPLLRQVIYVSQVPSTISKAAAQQIVGISQRNNRRVDATGILASTGKNFLQVLEGPPATVEATLKRIVRDSRHTNISIVSDRAVETRRFAGWSMALVLNLDLADDVEAIAQGELGADPDELLARPKGAWDSAPKPPSIEEFNSHLFS